MSNWNSNNTGLPEFDPYTGEANPYLNSKSTAIELEGEIVGYIEQEEITHRFNSHTGEEKAVRDFEKTYPSLAQAWKETQDEQYVLFARKMMDYGLSNIALGSTMESQEDIDLSLTGIWLRINDKINRLKNLLKRKGRNYVTDEPMIDSFLDIANYGIIAMLVMRGKWKK